MAQRDEIGARRRKAERRGHISEYVAAAYLMLKGYRILALGDLKPDFVGMITEVGGQVISLGRGGIGGINPLDAGPITKHLHLLSAKARAEVEGQIHGRRVNALGGLIELHYRLSRRDDPNIPADAVDQANHTPRAKLVQPAPAGVPPEGIPPLHLCLA